MSRTLAESSRRRLISEYGAPEHFTWQLLRSTCATYQCNAPSLFGAAAAFASAKRLGHAVAISEKLYASLFSVSRDARCLETAMGIESEMARIVEGARHGRHPRGRVAVPPGPVRRPL